MRLSLLLILILAVPAQAQEQDSAGRLTTQRRADTEAGTTDASLRSPFAVPTAAFETEISEDKKSATAKVGFAWGKYATTEVGVTGAFNKNKSINKLTSLRTLSPGSSLWVGTTWKKYRVRVDSVALSAVCRQAAWAAGVGVSAFECKESELSDESFASRLAQIAATPVERSVCQRFVRAMLSGAEVASGMDLNDPLCNGQLPMAALAARYGARFTESYLSRHSAAVARGDDAGALALCNEYRRSDRLPPTAGCEPGDLDADDKKLFARSWQDRLEKRRAERVAEVCDEFRQARGDVPTNSGDCAPLELDPIFQSSFRARYSETYRWQGTPMWGFRAEVSRQEFKYLDAALEPQEQKHDLYSISAHAGYLTVSDVLFVLQYSGGKTWSAQDPVQLCRPLVGTNGSTCIPDAILGEPTYEGRQQLEAQVKAFIGSSAAASFILTGDFARNAWGIEAPIYFMKDKDGGLNGGLVVSYKQEKDKPRVVGVSVFVGQVFDLF